MEKMLAQEPRIRVAALSSGRFDPSSRFRQRQYFSALRALNVDVTEYLPMVDKYIERSWRNGAWMRAPSAIAGRRYDAVWLNRELVAGRETVERLAGSRIVFEVDDAIWLEGKPGFAASIARKSAVVIAGNRAIADYFAPYARRLEVIPTTVDTERWTPAPVPRSASEFVVGWSGTWWNLHFLHEIEDELAAFLKSTPDAKLLIVCDREPEFRALPPERVVYRRWSPDHEVEALHAMDVSIMPLSDTDWTRAKCGLKMICSMSVGVPVVASPVGVVREILDSPDTGLMAQPGEWAATLTRLHADPLLRSRLSRAGRERIVQNYSVAGHVGTLARIFREVSAPRRGGAS